MAKVNLWLRGARGKFAGASLSKGTDGETIAREVVTPTNPNTIKQRYQRAVMATIMIMYSAFSELFDHSFQGKKKGSECQQHFMKRNIRILRNGLIEDMQSYNDTENPVDYNHLRNTVVVPKSTWPAPNAYVISEGSYQQKFFSLGQKALYEGSVQTAFVLSFPTPTDGQTVAQYAAANGLIAGDIYTLLMLATPYSDKRLSEYVAGKTPEGLDGGNGRYGAVSIKTSPAWVRLQVKTGLEEVVTPANSNLSTYFDITDVSDPEEVLADIASLTSGSFFTKITGESGSLVASVPVCAGVIRSRLDMDLRSSTTMSLNNEFAALAPQQNSNVVVTGITAPCIPNTWLNASGNLGESELILES